MVKTNRKGSSGLERFHPLRGRCAELEGTSLPTRHSVTPDWERKISHGGKMYTRKLFMALTQDFSFFQSSFASTQMPHTHTIIHSLSPDCTSIYSFPHPIFIEPLLRASTLEKEASPHFIHMKTEVQRSELTCPETQWQPSARHWECG